MSIAVSKAKLAFAVWITGLPSSGKSTLAAALAQALRDRGVDAAVLESDALRQVLTPHPVYSEEERDTFYQAITFIGRLLVEHDVPVIFDATANRRRYRDHARQQIASFLEIYVDCPLETCLKRDVKGIYRKAQAGGSSTVPGLQASYEPPEHPDLIIDGERERPEEAARRVVAKLIERRFLC